MKIHYLTLTHQGHPVKVTQNAAQYPLHHVTYAAAKFKVAISNGLGGDAFTRNVMDGCPDAPDRLWYEICLKNKVGIIIQV